MIRKSTTVFVAIIAMVSIFHSAFSQAIFELSLTDKVKNAAAIVEGRVLKKKSFWSKDKSMIHTRNVVEVMKVFKGEASSNTIDVYTPGGVVGDYFVHASESLELNPGDEGIFFLIPTELKSPESGEPLMDVYGWMQGFLRYDRKQNIADAPFVRYEGIKESLYPLLTKYPGLKLTELQTARVIPTETTSNLSTSLTSITPNTNIAAGAFTDSINNVITIRGTGFKVRAAKAGVFFDGADNGAGGVPLFISSYSNTVLIWTDTLIRMRTPGRIGSGSVWVSDSTGDSGGSKRIAVAYAMMDINFGTAAMPVYRMIDLTKSATSGGINYLLSTNTAGGGTDLSTAPERGPIDRAINTWKGTLGAPFIFKGNTLLQNVSPFDTNNVIMMDNLNKGISVLPAGALATTYTGGASCGSGLVAYNFGFDIAFKKVGISGVSAGALFNGPCENPLRPVNDPNTTLYDFENVALHEIGHALALSHVIELGQGNFPYNEPAGVMNSTASSGSERRSPDYTLTTGANFIFRMAAPAYGSCTNLVSATGTSYTIAVYDEFPTTFPSNALVDGTSINFNLVNATSNRITDPIYLRVTNLSTGASITNNLYYALKTGAASTGLNITISNYTLSPIEQAACTNGGVELSLYPISYAPLPAAFPIPTAYKIFNTNGSFQITGLQPNTTYVIMLDGVRNTKAKFTMQMSNVYSAAKMVSLQGIRQTQKDKLSWNIQGIDNVAFMELEASKDGNTYSRLFTLVNDESQAITQKSFESDAAYGPVHYRLTVKDSKGNAFISNKVFLSGAPSGLQIFPNPAKNKVSLSIAEGVSGKSFIEILDLAGKRVWIESREWAETVYTTGVDFSGKLAPGIYIMRLQSNGKTFTQKLQIK